MKTSWIGACLFFGLFTIHLQAAPPKIAVIPKGTTHSFWKSVQAGAEKAGQEFGAEIRWRGPNQDDDVKAQIYMIENAIAEKVQAIVLAPSHRTEVLNSVKNAVAQGIQIVVIDSALDGNSHLSFIATDNYQGGFQAGEYLVSLLQGKGKVILVRYVKGSASTDQREQGFVDALKASKSEITLALDEYVGASVGEAYHLSQGFLERVPDVAGIFAPNESSTAGVLRALEAIGKAGTIKLVGFDLSPTMAQGLQNKHLHGVMVQQPFQMGYLGVKTALEALNGKPVTPKVETKVVLITSENYQAPENQAFLQEIK